MLVDHSEFFYKIVPDVAGAILNMCTFAHNFEPNTCSCGLRFGHRGQHKCYDKHCPFTWVDQSKVNSKVTTIEETLVYCSSMELKKQTAIADSE